MGVLLVDFEKGRVVELLVDEVVEIRR
jgi:hypothetical protein